MSDDAGCELELGCNITRHVTRSRDGESCDLNDLTFKFYALYIVTGILRRVWTQLLTWVPINATNTLLTRFHRMET